MEIETGKTVTIDELFSYTIEDLDKAAVGPENCHVHKWLSEACFRCGSFNQCVKKVYILARQRAREKGLRL